METKLQEITSLCSFIQTVDWLSYTAPTAVIWSLHNLLLLVACFVYRKPGKCVLLLSITSLVEFMEGYRS